MTRKVAVTVLVVVLITDTEFEIALATYATSPVDARLMPTGLEGRIQPPGPVVSSSSTCP